MFRISFVSLVRCHKIHTSPILTCQSGNVTRLHQFKNATRLFSSTYFNKSPQRLPRTRNESKMTGSPITWATVLFAVSAGSIAVLLMKHYKAKKIEKFDLENIKSYGRPALGGDFYLVNQDGEKSSNRDFLGQWVLIYFGFTHCPDICPEELEKMGSIVDTIKRTDSIPNIQPLFISIDPERDSPVEVKKYIADFHSDLIGLTGTRDQVETASRAFRVYYSEGPKDSDDDYIVDHTVIMYLLNPEGEFCEYFGQNRSAGEMSSSITALISKYEFNKTTK